ncbi:hypothetical protein O988_06034 [Pseudogymnoascus sp. VKM F-3808]|nr:hypothetical protein O988_06034 [Pseudogymnoascus sp. VKM F-3808]
MNRQRCKISIEDKKDLFSYTSGRYVYNEKKRLAERYVEFDIEAVKLIAAESVSRQRVSHMKKLAEGGFNRVFLLKMDDGFEVIAMIPYHIAVPKHFTTESEVATLDFLQLKGVPVPRVYAWSSKSDNAVGESTTGDELHGVGKEAVALPIDAYGSLYYKENLPSHLQADIYASGTPDESDDAKRFCVGPTADYMARSSRLSPRHRHTRARMDAPLWDSSPKLLPHNTILEGNLAPEIHTGLLDKYLALSQYLLPRARGHLLNRPTLRHPDLNPANVFVSEDNFMNANPLRQPDPTPPKDYAAPSLPENYASLNPEEKSYADELHRRRMLFYLYMIFNGKDNKDHFSAMRTPVLAQRQHLIERAGMQWTGNTVTLKGALMRVVDGWGFFALEGHGKVECPISFSAEESEAFYELEEN